MSGEEHNETVSAVWAVPESYSCWRYKYRLKAAAALLAFGKHHSAAQNFYAAAAVEMAPVSMRGFYIIMPITQGLPQRNELRVEPGRRKQAVWPVPRARSTARQKCEKLQPFGSVVVMKTAAVLCIC